MSFEEVQMSPAKDETNPASQLTEQEWHERHAQYALALEQANTYEEIAAALEQYQESPTSTQILAVSAQNPRGSYIDAAPIVAQLRTNPALLETQPLYSGYDDALADALRRVRAGSGSAAE